MTQAQYIADLAATIEGKACPMAVVDYVGRRDADGFVPEAAPFSRRYGVRDMRHVEIYGLAVVSLNLSAQVAA